MAQLKPGSQGGDRPATARFHGWKSVAQLKLRLGGTLPKPDIKFPRMQIRGPIEASTTTACAPCTAICFHGCKSVAHLKLALDRGEPLGFGVFHGCKSVAHLKQLLRCADQCGGQCFHGCKSVAHLKQGASIPARGAKKGFHGCKSVAQLKLAPAHVVPDQSLQFPRMQIRGSIEAPTLCNRDWPLSKFPRMQIRGSIEAHGRNNRGDAMCLVSTDSNPWPY